jgi:hypothetical protein
MNLHKGAVMLKSGLLAAGILVSFAVPSFADYYIVHGPDRHCRVVERYVPGQERDLVRVGPLSFGTREEAERQVRVVCRDDGYYREERPERRERDRD